MEAAGGRLTLFVPTSEIDDIHRLEQGVLKLVEAGISA